MRQCPGNTVVQHGQRSQNKPQQSLKPYQVLLYYSCITPGLVCEAENIIEVNAFSPLQEPSNRKKELVSKVPCFRCSTRFYLSQDFQKEKRYLLARTVCFIVVVRYASTWDYSSESARQRYISSEKKFNEGFPDVRLQIYGIRLPTFCKHTAPAPLLDRYCAVSLHKRLQQRQSDWLRSFLYFPKMNATHHAESDSFAMNLIINGDGHPHVMHVWNCTG